MELFSDLAHGFGIALTFTNLLYCLIGVTIGTAIGVLPGVGPLVTISLALPITFGLPVDNAIIMLAGIFYGAQYGGSTTSILLNLPGEAASVVTCLDGHQMAKQGRAGAALAIAAISSLVAGIVGTILIAMCAPPLSAIALDFQSPEYVSLTVLALVWTSTLMSESRLKGMMMAISGMLFGTIGIDVDSGIGRHVFGVLSLMEGIEFTIVAIGLFAFSEMVVNAGQQSDAVVINQKVGRLWLKMSELKQSIGAMLRGTAIGSLIGVLPGVGASVSSFVAYIVEKRVSRDPAAFGKGAIQGVASPEAANNAAAQTSFIPTLTLGVPGSATMALFLGALMMQGINPGPQIIERYPDLFWGLIASMFIGNVFLVILNLPLVGIWTSLLRVPFQSLMPAVLIFSCVGVYAVRSNPLDLIICSLFGLIGWLFLRLNCDRTPFILGFILGPLLEENLRRTLILSDGDLTVLISRPISATLLALAIGGVILGLFAGKRVPVGED